MLTSLARRFLRGANIQPHTRGSRFRKLAAEALESRFVLAVQHTGLFVNDPQAFDGYTLFSPNGATGTYLINNAGTVINTWDSNFGPGLHARILPDGNLLRGAVVPPNPIAIPANGFAGRLELFSWEGDLLWTYNISGSQQVSHHDFDVLPNGNIIVLVWEQMTGAQAIAAGRNPAIEGTEQLIPDTILEIQPDYVNGGGTVVWKWSSWDHLVQEFDSTKDNWHGPNGVENNPQLIDINYVAHGLAGSGFPREDFTHANSIDYHPEYDMIMISVREYNEIWIIDHSTTTEEAAGSTGGNSGKGGDLLYRYGNPAAYDRGTHANDRVNFWQHDANWIVDGDPLTPDPVVFFNNGTDRPGLGNRSSADEFTPPLVITPLGGGNFDYEFTPPAAGQPFLPAEPEWTYLAPASLYSPIISGAQRLPNGNTFITFGTSGTLVEVTPAGQIVWKFVNPVTGAKVLGKFEEPGTVLPNLPDLKANFIFRATKYAPDFPGFAGKDLTPEFRDTIGLVDPASWTWYLNNEVGGGTQNLLTFKTPIIPASWVALAGDWNGDGIDTIGVYDPVGRRFYLNNEVDGTIDTVFNFQTSVHGPGWTPIVGDWDGDGTDTVGFYHAATSRWFLFDSNSNSPAGLIQIQSPRVPTNWRPIVGDWNSDGVDTIGLFDNINHTWYLRNENDNVVDDLIVFSTPLSPTTWIPIIGDWNDDGQDSIGLFDQFTSTWYLNNDIDGTFDDMLVFQTPRVPSNWKPVIGNWDGSGIHGGGGSALTAVLSLPGDEEGPIVVETAGPPPADFNGDGAINLIDLLELVNYLSNSSPGGGDDDRFDVNGDGDVTIFDVLAVVNMITAQYSDGSLAPEGEGNSASPAFLASAGAPASAERGFSTTSALESSISEGGPTTSVASTGSSLAFAGTLFLATPVVGSTTVEESSSQDSALEAAVYELSQASRRDAAAPGMAADEEIDTPVTALFDRRAEEELGEVIDLITQDMFS